MPTYVYLHVKLIIVLLIFSKRMTIIKYKPYSHICHTPQKRCRVV